MLELILPLVNKNINSTILNIKPVKQRDNFGCAVACVAFILRIEYGIARDLFVDGKRRSKEEANFYCKEIVGILANAGLSYQYRYLKKRLKRKMYNLNTIIYIKKSKRYPYGHYLCRYKDMWMDPWINFPSRKITAGFRKRLPEKPIYVIYAT